jgi:bifunctional enzyme CysN/CysC
MSAALRAPAPTRPQAANDADGAPRTLLRFITCGSVDDGKSTLIGRLLHDAGAVPEDVLATLRADSGGDALDYSLLVDGLAAEREQGITIDVAYRYFATHRRSFIVADTPGHEQYTRNTATGASSAELAVILIDARKGVLPQTRRHSLVVSLVGVSHVIVAINKIDLVGFDEQRIRAIEADYREAVAGLGFRSITVVPVSARDGDNVVARSGRTPWYDGPTLLGWLETVAVSQDGAAGGFVMPVQWVNRPDLDFRGFAGTIAAGAIKPGDAVTALPSGLGAQVVRIATFDGDLAVAGVGQAVTVTLDREIDISRGDVLVASRRGDAAPTARTEATARILVTADRVVAAGDEFVLRIGTASASARVVEVAQATDIATFRNREAASLGLNDLGEVRLRFDRPLAIAAYASSRALGALILVDRVTNATAAMGVILADAEPGANDRVVAFRRVADRTFENALGPHWRQEIAPAASWRVGSALLLGLVVTMATDHPGWGLAAAMADAAVRPLLRFLHRHVWSRLRAGRDA